MSLNARVKYIIQARKNRCLPLINRMDYLSRHPVDYSGWLMNMGPWWWWIVHHSPFDYDCDCPTVKDFIETHNKRKLPTKFELSDGCTRISKIETRVTGDKQITYKLS